MATLTEILKDVQSTEIGMEIGTEIWTEIWTEFWMGLKWKETTLVDQGLQELMAVQIW